MKNEQRKKVLFICSRDINYTRNEFIAGLLQKKYDADIVFSNQRYYCVRIARVFWSYLKIKNKKKYDFIYVGFFAQALIPLVRCFYSGKIIGDYFISLHDTLCLDRKIFNKNSRRMVIC